MIHHGIRMKLRKDVTPEQFDEALECLREQGSIPAVSSFVFGPEYNSDFDWSAIFALEDLDAYWDYLVHPLHVKSERLGFPLMEKFESFDISDTSDPALGAEIAELQKRNYDTDPELAELVSRLPSHTGSSALPHAG
ncbi:Dabb family protein [Nocardia sp. BMG51109]|uniref:Dabb family protein n=1 Tax=Nocardia sp. BMG51109 TaxID=1056816 RepID=UPI0004648352|nr:Dabb family protein [Nocardia sp. BMG51109]